LPELRFDQSACDRRVTYFGGALSPSSVVSPESCPLRRFSVLIACALKYLSLGVCVLLCGASELGRRQAAQMCQRQGKAPRKSLSLSSNIISSPQASCSHIVSSTSTHPTARYSPTRDTRLSATMDCATAARCTATATAARLRARNLSIAHVLLHCYLLCR
jgi:hypothetical protein